MSCEDGLRTELTRNKCKLAQSEEGLSALQTRYEKLYSELEEKFVEVTSAEHQLLRLRGEKEGAEGEVKRLEAEVKVKDAELDRLRKALEEEQRQVAFLTRRWEEKGSGQGRSPHLTLSPEPVQNGQLAVEVQVQRQGDQNEGTMELSEIPEPSASASQRFHISPMDASTPTTPPTLIVLSKMPTARVNRPSPEPEPVNPKKARGGRPRKTMKVVPLDLPGPALEKENDDSTEEESRLLLSTTLVTFDGTLDWRTPKETKYVLVRLSPLTSKGLSKYFVARITGKRCGTGGMIYRVDYLVKKTGTTTPLSFVNKESELEYEIDEAQVAQILQKPNVGRRGIFTFPKFDFEPFLLG